VAIFFASTADPSMFTLAGIMNILSPAAQLGILAIAAALLMIGGEFDLSIGSMVAFTGLIFGAFITLSGWPLLPAIAATLAIAAVLGGLNGQLVIRTRLPSFIVTLAFLFILRGLSLVGLKWATGGSTQMRGIGDQAGEGFIRELFSGNALEGLFAWLAANDLIGKFPNGTPTVTGVPVSIVWFIGFALLATWISCARGRATGSLRPAAIPMRRAIPAYRWTGSRRRSSCSPLLLRPWSPSSRCSMRARRMRGGDSRRSSRPSSRR
jgi:simple sugar transport system permease protein